MLGGIVRLILSLTPPRCALRGQPAVVQIRSRRICRTGGFSSQSSPSEMQNAPCGALCISGGESGIRTHGSVTTTAVFKTAALNRSAISPELVVCCKARAARHYGSFTSGIPGSSPGQAPPSRQAPAALNRSAISPRNAHCTASRVTSQREGLARLMARRR